MTIEVAAFGTLGRDAERKTSKNGRPYLRLNVACGEGDATQWVSATVFDERAIAVTDKLVKGRVYLEGKLSLNEVLREVYNDPAASPAHRIKAAGLALPHEVPRLESVPPPLELVAEPVEPLAEVVRRQRARADKMLR